MIRYALTIFLSAFLLFQIQPVIARFILPWFGGTAAVWTTCLMFFQTVLLFGYLYAHLLRRFCSPNMAWVIHVFVLAGAAACSWIIPPSSLHPSGMENMTVAIVKVLAVSVGLPFFALSTTGPLIQAWQSSSHKDQSPYRLYALSNLGSILALLTYPFLIERFLPLEWQAKLWTFGFLIFTLCCCWSGWQTIRSDHWNNELVDDPTSTGSVQKPTAWQPLVWVLLSMSASIVLLATTNLMCQEVASVPFLWILPLSLYLLSFIICFDRPAFYRRRVFVPMLVVGAILSIAIIHLNVFAGLALQLGGLSMACFAASMTCHGELERMKPAPRFLTSFYLWISVGGALGGIFVCVVSPHVFDGFCEFHIGILICLVVSMFAIYKSAKSDDLLGGKPSPSQAVFKAGAMGGIFLALAIVTSSLTYFLDPSYQKGLVYRGRNEYGLASVEDAEDQSYRRFVNGRIEHGGQSLEPGKQRDHISYYVPGSGVGVAFESMRSASDRPLNVGVLGLGAGAMTTWLEPEDEIVFYEINPIVEEIAKNYFTFLSDSPAKTSVVLGDGRFQLQQRLEQSGPAKFDLLFMDAFASDSIPVHLLTSEALELYFEHLKPEGILIVHITNRFIDLRPVLAHHVADRKLFSALIDFASEDEKVQTRWVLMTRNKKNLESKAIVDHQIPWPEDLKSVSWTDNYTSVAALLDWSAKVDWDRMDIARRKDDGANKAND